MSPAALPHYCEAQEVETHTGSERDVAQRCLFDPDQERHRLGLWLREVRDELETRKDPELDQR